MTVDVTPFLREGEDVFVKECACAMAILESGSVRVVPRTPITDPIIVPPVTRLDAFVNVHNTTRDAIVEVLRKRADGSWEIIGTQRANGTLTHVPLTIVDLATGQLVRVRQRICATQTDGDATVTVVKPPPQRPILQTPPDGKEIARNTALTMSWTDPAPQGTRRPTTSRSVFSTEGPRSLKVRRRPPRQRSRPRTRRHSRHPSPGCCRRERHRIDLVDDVLFPHAEGPEASHPGGAGHGQDQGHRQRIHPGPSGCHSYPGRVQRTRGEPRHPGTSRRQPQWRRASHLENDGTLDYAFQPASVLPMLTVPKSGAPYTRHHTRAQRSL